MSPKLAMIALSIVPPIALVSRYYGRYVQKITRAVQDSLAASTQVCGQSTLISRMYICIIFKPLCAGNCQMSLVDLLIQILLNLKHPLMGKAFQSTAY